MDLPYKVDDRQPSHPLRNGGADIEVNSGDKEEAVRLDQPGYVEQALFRRGGRHVAEKPVRHDDVLRADDIEQPWIACIPVAPGHAFPQPGPDLCLSVLDLEDFP